MAIAVSATPPTVGTDAVLALLTALRAAGWTVLAKGDGTWACARSGAFASPRPRRADPHLEITRS